MFTGSKKYLLPLLTAIILLAGTGCEINRLKSAEELYGSKRFAAAIVELDDLIDSGKNGAIVTRAELLRSDSYYALGEAAAQRQNWALAERFHKLANSREANLRLAEIYQTLGYEAFKSGAPDLGKSYLDAVIREAPDSPLIPEVRYRRIGYFMEVSNNQDAAWRDYMKLFDEYPNNPYEIQARSYVLKFVPAKIEYAKVLSKQEYYTDALNLLFELSKYPVVDVSKLNLQISEVYQSQAEEYIEAQDYVEADRLFRIAMQYYPEKKAQITRRLEAITSLYVSKGNSLLEAGDYANALVHYRKTFDIIPDYQPALDAINRLLTIQDNIRRAVELAAEGDRFEATGKHVDAVNAFNKAHSLDPKPEYRQKAIQMQNLIDASKNPVAFTRKIIDEYRGGLLNTRIRNQKQELQKRNKASDIRDSGWKILLSTGQYKYEARYDLLTPTETFLYVWQINLRDKSIVPLNRLSEALLR
ncbi:MAG: hypothetical protein CVU50_06660 [Candidatus Cloacimonetes bacterium HGW-Cloacimonetes-3]|jgi:hypothetical protein|nr:MAG: hypothetical protein CVU50_06660 [Candidatus Cloacimonetes bacterium HGW-Cloacimonetes-3]